MVREEEEEEEEEQEEEEEDNERRTLRNPLPEIWCGEAATLISSLGCVR